MPDFSVFSDIFSFSFMRYAFFASICIGILCPTIGIFIVLRRFSLLGDTLAHASLAGAATGILCSGNPIPYAIGYSVAAGAGIDLLQSRFPRRSDLTLAIVLALSAGIAVTLMSSGLLHANAESFLFGSILTVDRSDAIAILVLTAAAVLLTFLLRYDMIYVAFDEVAAKFAGVRIRAVSFLFSVIAAASVAASIKILGALVIARWSRSRSPRRFSSVKESARRPSFPSRFLWFQRSAGSSPPMRSMSRQGAPQP